MAEQQFRSVDLDDFEEIPDQRSRDSFRQLFDNTRNLQAQIDKLVELVTNSKDLGVLQAQVSESFTTSTTTTSTETDVSAFSAQFSAINHNHDSQYNNYTLPQSSSTVLGGLKLGANLTYNSSTDQVDATDTNTTYSLATTSANGLMSSSDKSKLNGIASGANYFTYSLPTATSSTKGGVKVGSTLSISNEVLDVGSNVVTTSFSSYSALRGVIGGFIQNNSYYSSAPTTLSIYSGGYLYSFVANSSHTAFMIYRGTSSSNSSFWKFIT